MFRLRSRLSRARALVFASALILSGLAFWAGQHVSQVLAQTAPAATTQGNPAVGPNEANVNPVISDKVTGIPFVVIIKATESPQIWQDKIARYGTALPLVIRVADVNVQNVSQPWSQKGQALAGVLAATGKTGSIVVFGNEVNNLDREWLSRSAPSDASQVSAAEVQEAAQTYAAMFAAFRSGLGSAGRLAPSPPDMSNPIYPWQAWVTPIADTISGAEVRVLNVYEVGGSVQDKIAAFQAYGSVDFLTEVGLDPAEKDLTAHVAFLNGLRLSMPATTLVPNHCQTNGWQNGGSVDDWLFYVRGTLYDRLGNVIEPSTCGSNTQPVASGNPVFLYPNPNLDQATFQQELDMYLANSQAYCAPAQIYWPERPVTGELLSPCSPGEVATWVQGVGAVCRPEDYEPVDFEESISMTGFSFPLFRSDAGGISIESDLSRFRPGETFYDALLSNTRADVAPQFFLSTPQNQCSSAVKYLEYVKNLCVQDGYPVGQQEECGANLPVRLADGTTKHIMEFQTVDTLASATSCENFTLDDVANNTLRAQAVQAITPFTPKVFKIGFYVQHTKLSGTKQGILEAFSQVTQRASQMVAWFRGQESSYPEPQERVDIIPVWYHAGITSSQYDSNQLVPYAFDLRQYSTNGQVTPKNFDVAQTALANAQANLGSVESRNQTSRQSSVAIPQVNEANYTGPLWRTYSFVLPQHTQDKIATRRLQVVFQNYFLLQTMRDQFFGASEVSKENLVATVGSEAFSLLGLDKEWFWRQNTTQYRLPFECRVAGGGEGDPGYRTCALFRETTYDPDTDSVSPLQPLAQSYEEVSDMFPERIAATNKANLDFLKKSLIARINAGVQTTLPYGQTELPNQPVGPLSVRQIGNDMCNVDQANVRQGEQEHAETITSSALQPLDRVDETLSPPRQVINQVVNKLSAWIYGGPRPDDSVPGTKYMTDRVTRGYLILPDEALSIETLQSYTASLFLSPEMYESIVTGENDVYPFAQRWQELLAEQDAADQSQPIKLSSFLRTLGPTRILTSQQTGFVKIREARYQARCQVDPINRDQICGCGDLIGYGPERWVTLSSFDATSRPTGANGCVGSEEIERRVVNVSGVQPGKQPDTGVNVPGNLAALGEFVRRLAFTPTHLQGETNYTGLEDFYGGMGQTGGSTAVGGSCVYQPKEYDITTQGYTTGTLNTPNETIKGDICSAAASSGIDGGLLRAILAIEGGPFLDALSGIGTRQGGSGPTKYMCQPNSSGAIGPFQRVVGQCSSSQATKNLFNEDNTLNPDICTLKGALQPTTRHLRSIDTYVKSQSSAQPGSLEYYERMAERYLGSGSCGEFLNPIDGAGKVMPTADSSCQFNYNGQSYPCSQVDYCSFAADRATEEYAGYCQ